MTVVVASDGTFTIADAPVDTYTIGASADGYQPATDVTLGVVAADVMMSTIELMGGIVTLDDDLVDGADISAVVASFGDTPGARVDGSGNWVDINGDSAVSGVDLSIAVTNVGLSGTASW